MSTTAKVLLFLLGGGLVLSLLCCGGAVYFVGKAKRAIQAETSSDPAKVRELTGEMIDIDIPESYVPKQFANLLVMRLAVYEQSAPAKGQLTLVELNAMISQNAEMKKQQDEMLKQGPGPQVEKHLKDEVHETREIEIKGKKSTFEFIEGTDDHGTKMRIVRGFVPGKRGAVMLQLTVPDEEFDEEEVEALLHSIR